MRRGEIRWYTFRPPDKRRPVLILTRDEIIDELGELIVAPLTRTVRGLHTEVFLGVADGFTTPCVINFDHISLAQRDRFGGLLCNLNPERWEEAKNALLIACGFAAGTEEGIAG